MNDARPFVSSPYKGLTAFEDSDLDALLFFGRERDTDTIAANLMASRFTVLYGPLGVGKSSVLRAGVVRRLRSVAPDAAVVVNDSWAGDPRGEVARAVATRLGVEPPIDGSPLADGLAVTTSRFPGEVYLVFDQFEELFVYPNAEAVAAELSEVVSAKHLRVNVLLALREDALAELDVFTGRIPNVFGNYLSLERLDRAAAREAVLGPLARYNELAEAHVEIEPDLVEAVLDEVEAGRVSLEGNPLGATSNGNAPTIEAPYLQLVMQRLWDAERGQGSEVLRLATFDSLGRAEAIVRAHLDDAMEALPDRQRDVAARIFNHLVTPSGTKIAHDVDDLAGYADAGEEEVGSVVASLGERRILRPVDGRWEIYHDVLAEAVLAWRARHETERALAREREAARRRHQRLLVLLVAALVALAAMAAVTIYALTQRANAREQASLARAEASNAEANALSAEAGVLIPVTPPETDPELGLLLAAEAARRLPTHRAADTLRRALLVSHLRAVLPDRHVAAASFSPDGERILVATLGGAVRVYSKEDQTRLSGFRAEGPLTNASFSPDGAHILTTVRAGPATISDATGERSASFGRAPTSASFNSDGSLVLTVEGGKAKVWTAGGAPVATLHQPQPVTAASFGPDGGSVVAFGDGPKAWVFGTGGRLIGTVNQHSQVTSATLVPKSGLLVTAGVDGAARLWSVVHGVRLLHVLRGQGSLTGAAVAPDGRLLVTTSKDTTARVWTLPSGALVSDLIGHSNRVNGVGFSKDGSAFVTWSADGTARVWDRGRGAARIILAGHGDVVTGAAFDESGKQVLTTSANGKARLWASRVDSELQPIAEISRPIVAAEFSRDGNRAAVAGKDGIEVLDGEGRRLTTLPARSPKALAVNRDGSLVAAATGLQISIWRPPGTEAADTVDIPVAPTALALDPVRVRLAIGAPDGRTRVWTQGQESFTTLPGPDAVTSIAFSPEGERLAVGYANGALQEWDLPDGRMLFRTTRHSPGTAVLSIAFNTTGDRLVTAGADTTARVWDAASGRMLYTLRGHASSVNDAAFDPTGRWVVTAGRSLAGLWDRASGQRLLFLTGGESHLLASSFDPSGLRIMTVGADGTLRSYSCKVCAGVPGLLRYASLRLRATGRELTPAERQRYLGG